MTGHAQKTANQVARADPADLGDYRVEIHFYSRDEEVNHGIYMQGAGRRAVIKELRFALRLLGEGID